MSVALGLNRSFPPPDDGISDADEERLYAVLLAAECQARGWINHPESAPTEIQGMPLVVLPHALYQTVDLKRMANMSVIATANGLCLCCLSRRRPLIWPRIYCDRLRAAVIHAVRHNAHAVFRRAAAATADEKPQLGLLPMKERPPVTSTVEIAGDIICFGNRSSPGAQWQIACVVCEDPKATNTSSVPTCNRTRQCANPDRPATPGAGAARDARRDRGFLVGEFHSHPQHDPRHIKPPSDYDLYQLTLAAANGVHSCSAVIAYEGVYWCAASGKTLSELLPEIRAYYRMQGVGSSDRRRSMNACRQPVAENVPSDLRCLHWLLRGLRKQYVDLMGTAANQEQTELAKRFLGLLAQHGYSGLFLPWQTHPHRWTGPADAQISDRKVVTMLPPAAAGDR